MKSLVVAMPSSATLAPGTSAALAQSPGTTAGAHERQGEMKA
jgi:hypothetical protein